MRESCAISGVLPYEIILLVAHCKVMMAGSGFGRAPTPGLAIIQFQPLFDKASERIRQRSLPD
ncbi:MAG TPA: hypothetical protein VGG72_05310 [Bryobacteraceae bacterium]